jgi:spore coat protein U-like protein
MDNRMIGRTAAAVCAAALAAATGVSAQQGGQTTLGGQSSANMQVNANVIRKCTISTQPLAFGNYDPVLANATAPLDVQTTITVACTKGTSVNIAMDAGDNAAGSLRRMVDGRRAFLAYEVYKDSSRTQRWGDGLGERLDGGIAPSRDPRQFIAYGRVPGGQDVAEGTFQDTVVVTVQF